MDWRIRLSARGARKRTIITVADLFSRLSRLASSAFAGTLARSRTLGRPGYVSRPAAQPFLFQ